MILCDIVKIENCRYCPFREYTECAMLSVDMIINELTRLKELSHDILIELAEE